MSGNELINRHDVPHRLRCRRLVFPRAPAQGTHQPPATQSRSVGKLWPNCGILGAGLGWSGL